MIFLLYFFFLFQIIEDNQKGVLSKKYVPGPLSQMEKGLEKFKTWYLKHLENSLT